MTVGTDTYVTLEDADAYIEARYSGADAERWAALEEIQREALLLSACEEIEALPLIGRKLYINQTLAFPRWPSDDYVPDFRTVGVLVGTVPQKVINAQCELALWLSDTAKTADSATRASLQAQGVKSFSIGDLSESYSAGASAVPAPLLCPKCRTLLKPYTEGSFLTC